MPEFPVVSLLEIIDIQSATRRIVHQSHSLFEAPNWSKDGKFLIFNQEGALYKFSLDAKETQKIDTGFANRNNNDHGLSSDGKHIAISHHSEQDNGDSIIYIVPIEGGNPERITSKGPSYWHGWSPDGKTLAYVAGREHSPHYNIYCIDIESKKETQLTFTQGLDDGPEYSPCGNYIYYNSYKSGKMQIWRMTADGEQQIQLVNSPHSDWFPHPSPDGKYLTFLRYIQDQQEAHPFGQSVQLMLYNIETAELKELTDEFYGGQGTINVPSWSPDSQEFAFVSYQRLPS